MAGLFGAGSRTSWWRSRTAPEPARVPPLQDPVRWGPRLPRETALHLQLQSIKEEVEREAATGVRDDPDVNRRVEAMYRRLNEIRAELDT